MSDNPPSCFMGRFMKFVILVGPLCPHLIAAPTTVRPDDPNSDDPEVERKMLQLPTGFDIQLFASEPFSAAGIDEVSCAGPDVGVCIPRYPQMLPGQDAIDYIAVLEDTQGKGRADKSHIFVRGCASQREWSPMMPAVRTSARATCSCISRITPIAEKPMNGKSSFPALEPRTPITRSTRSRGARTDCSISIRDGTSTAASKRHAACAAASAAASGNFIPIRWRWKSTIARSRSTIPGADFRSYGQPIIASAWPANINLVLPTRRSIGPTIRVVPSLKMTKLAGERHSGMEIITGRHFPPDWQNNLVTGSFNSRGPAVLKFSTKPIGFRSRSSTR